MLTHSTIRKTTLILRTLLYVWIVLTLASVAARAQEDVPSAPGAAVVGQSASVNGMVLDPAGAVIANVRVTITMQSASQPVMRETRTGSDGAFSIVGLPAGAFLLRFEATDFAKEEVRGTLRPGESYRVPDVKLPLAGTATDVQVTYTSLEIAQQQIELQEKQRIFGAIPNFYVSYDPNPQPMSSGQKYHLALRTLVDPAAFVISGIIAGAEQANNTYSGYGQGAQGYAKRYGASYADFASGTMIGGAILPALLKQDPRYFYQGTGGVRSRALHAIARSVICRGDNGRNQFDYSGILGGLAASGLSNAYYPAKDRNGAGLTFENLGIGIAGSAVGNLFQEFLVRKLSTGTRPKAKP